MNTPLDIVGSDFQAKADARLKELSLLYGCRRAFHELIKELNFTFNHKKESEVFEIACLSQQRICSKTA